MEEQQSKERQEAREAFQQQLQMNKALVASYKKDINLVTFLQDQGWVINAKKSSINWSILEDPTSGQRIRVHRVRETGDYVYSSMNDLQGVKGNIIHLVADKLNLDLGPGKQAFHNWNKLHEFLSPMVGNLYASHDYMKPLRINELPKMSQQAQEDYLNIRPLTDRNWLHNRGISDRTIEAPEFKGQIVERPYEIKREQGAYTGVNTAFPFRDLTSLITLNLRNSSATKSFNSFLSEKGGSLWMSNVLPGTKVKEIVVAESPPDALAHYQLHPPRNPGERVYLSCGGQPGTPQYETVQKVINKLKPDQVIIANDNDFAGIRFNINFLGQLYNHNQEPSPFRVYISGNDKESPGQEHSRMNFMRISMQVPTANGNELIKKMAEIINQKMNAGVPSPDMQVKVSIQENHLKLPELVIGFRGSRQLLIRAENITKDLLQKNQSIVVSRSQEKDWNDDLKVQIKKIEKNFQQPPETRLQSDRYSTPKTAEPEWFNRLRETMKKPSDLDITKGKKVEVGPTGLPIHQYSKQEIKNTLPNDGPLRRRKEHEGLQPKTAENKKSDEKPVKANKQAKLSGDNSTPKRHRR